MLAALNFPNFSPDIFSVTIAGFTIAPKWYAAAYIVGILIARWITIAAVKRPALWAKNTPPMTDEQADAFVTWAILGVIIGGRLGYVLFYNPGYYLQNPIEALYIWQGGMAYHGGLLGVIVAGVFFARQYAIPRISMMDAVALGVPTGLLLGRLANFINAELWGRPTELPWGIIFPGEAAQACINTALGACARHPSQLYEALGEGLILGILLLFLAFRRAALARVGMISGLFFVGYGIVRFLVEFVRQPDAQFQTATNPVGYAIQLGEWGLTQGQILTLPMLAVGLFLILRARPA